MPLYDYECPTCGSFREWRSMSQYRRGAACPTCGKSAARSVATPILAMDAGRRKSHAINEKSAHEPRVVRRRRGDPIPQHDAHADLVSARAERASKHCGHQHAKAHASHHPWMVRH
jgi:putative FmdB family regulatory protein